MSKCVHVVIWAARVSGTFHRCYLCFKFRTTSLVTVTGRCPFGQVDCGQVRGGGSPARLEKGPASAKAGAAPPASRT